MKHQEAFEQHVLITRVAMQQELNERRWQPPIRDLETCPVCQSRNFSKLAKSKNGKTHRCKDCDSQFSADDVPGCTCWFPGDLAKCQSCDHYRRIHKGVKARIEEALKDMTVEEAETLLATPSFYLNRRKLPPKPVKPTPPPQPKVTKPQTGKQLDLF